MCSSDVELAKKQTVSVRFDSSWIHSKHLRILFTKLYTFSYHKMYFILQSNETKTRKEVNTYLIGESFQIAPIAFTFFFS